MALVVHKKPDVKVNTEDSRWNAVHHPIVFEVQRADQMVDFRTLAGSNQIIQLVGPVEAGTASGDKILYVDPNGTTHILTVESYSPLSPNTLVIVESLPLTVYGGHINYLGTRKNYFVESEVFIIDNSNVLVSQGKMKHRTTPDGIARMNVSQWLKPFAEYADKFDYDQINEGVDGEGGRYQVRFREIYDGFQGGQLNILGTQFWSNSSKQIQDLYGSNMGEYVPTIDEERIDKAKFMTMFKKPTYFVGYPFSLNFIYSDNLKNLQITREEERFDVNDGSLSTSSTELIYSERFKVNRLMLTGDYSSDIEEVDVWLEIGDVIEINEVERDEAFPRDQYSDGSIFGPFLEDEPIKDVPVS